MRKKIKRRSTLALAIVASFAGVAAAQSGSWNVDASGNWSDTANWAGGIPANGSGFTATFANDLTDDRTVTLDSARTITNLTFGDANPATAGSWIFSNGGTAANILTLAGTTPTINVGALGTGKSVSMGAVIAGTVGLTKTGSGTLILSNNANTFTGGVNVSDGTLQVGTGANNTGNLVSSNSITVGSGAVLEFRRSNTSTSVAIANDFNSGAGTLRLTGANDGLANGLSNPIGVYNLSGNNSALSNSFTIAANSARLTITGTSQIGSSKLVSENNGQLHFGSSGTFSNAITLQGNGWSDATGNLGALRLTSTTLSGTITLANDARVTTQNNTSTSTLSGVIAQTGGARTLEIGGAAVGSNITLAGANTYTGGTIINGPLGTSDILSTIYTALTLNYASQNNSKLSDSSVLLFKGPSRLILAGGTHPELVGSTTLDAGASASITRSSGNTSLNLGALTRNSAASLNVDATTPVKTSSGIAGEVFGSWFTFGTNLATKDASGNIIAATYTDVSTLTGTIVEGPATNVRLTENSSGTVPLGGSPGDTITLNTLTRQVTGLAKLDIAGKTLRIQNGILSNSNSSGFIFGNAIDEGVLTAGTAIDTPGTLEMNIAASTGSVIVRSTITDNGTGAVSLVKMGLGDLTLNGTNTYSGGTTLSGGTIGISNNSAFGSGPITVASASIVESSVSVPSDYSIHNNIVLNSSATLTLNTVVTNFDLNGVISGTGNFTVDGFSGTYAATLKNTNTYTGRTTVTEGKLLLGNGGNLAATPITVENSGIFGIRQNANNTTNTIAGALTFNTGGAFTMADGFTSTLNVGGTATFIGFSTNSTLSFDLGGTTTAADRMTVTGAALGVGGSVITINGIGTTAPTPGAYTIISAASGLNATNFTLAKTKTLVNGTAYELSLTNTATASIINVTGLSGLDAAYWRGDQNGAWNANNSGNTNWSTAADGVTDSGATPNTVTDVFFSASGAENLTTTLGEDTTIYSLTYTATSGATTIGAGNTLTIGNTGAVTAGINVANGSAAQTINAPIILGAAQSWTNNGTNTLTVGGAVNNGGFGLTIPGTGSTTISGALSGSGGLTKSGSGTLTVSGTNSYTGGTTLIGGILKVTSSSGLGPAGRMLTFNNTGSLQLASDTPVSSKNVTLGGNMIVVLDRETAGAGLTTTFGGLTSTSGSRTITVSNGSNVTSGTSTLTFDSLIVLHATTTTFDPGAGTAINLSGGTFPVTQLITANKNGLGTLIFSGNNTSWDTGSMALNAGTLELRTRLGDNTAFSAPITAAANTTVRLVADTGTQYISTLTVNGNVQVVADRLTSAATSTTHSLGYLNIGAQTLTIARGSNITGAGVAGVTFNEIVNSSTGTTTLTGNATFNTEANTLLTIKGPTSGAFSLTKTGPGSMTLSAANTYSGGTVINAGTLNLAFGTTTSNILASTGALTLGGGTLNLTGTGTQTVGGLTTSLATNSSISLAANETLTLGALTSAGAGSTLNLNTVAGGANSSTGTLGTGIVTMTGQTAGRSINIGYTVTDAGGTGLATVNASNQVIRMSAAISTLLPASGAVIGTDYLINNNAGGVDGPGSSGLVVTASQSTRTISVDTTAASGILTLNSGFALRNNGWLFSGSGSNTYKITGAGTLTAAASGNPITFNNLNSGAVTIESVIAANGTNNVGFTGSGTTVLAATNTYTGTTGIASGIVQVGPGGTLDGTATAGAINTGSTVTITPGAKLIYNRAGQTNILAGAGAVEYYGANNGTTGGTGHTVTLNNGSTGFSGTMLINGIRATVDNVGDLGTALVTVAPTGQLYAGGQTLSNNFIISGTGWGEIAGAIGALRLDGTIVNGTITLVDDARIGTSQTNNGTINGVIGETGGARKLQIGGGTTSDHFTRLTLNAANAYTGGTDIGSATSTATTVNVGNNGALSTGTVNVLSNATLASSGAARTLTNPFTIASGKTLSLSGAGGMLTLAGNISGSGNLTHTANSATLAGSNTYLGTTTINAGALTFAKQVSLYNNDEAQWTAANLIFNSGATAGFNIGGAGEFTITKINTLLATSTAAGGFKSGAILGLDTTNAGGSFTIASPIVNPNGGANVLGLTKLGSGTLVLTGASTYTGPTAVDGGTLKVDGSLQTAGTSVRTGTTLEVSGSITSSGSMLVSNTGALLLKSGSAVTLGGGFDLGGTASGQNLTIESDATLSMSNAFTVSYVPNLFKVDGQVNISGNLAIAATPSATVTLTGSGTISANTGSIGNASSTFDVNMPGGTVNYAGLLTLGGSGVVSNTLMVTNGTVNAASGIQMGVSGTTVPQAVRMNGGRLNIGAPGFTSVGGSFRSITFNNGTVGASGDWSTANNVSLNGSAPGTTFNTLDSVDNTTARTITLGGLLIGSGRLIKEGAGTLNLTNTGNHTLEETTTVNGGTLLVNGTFLYSAVTVNSGATLGGAGTFNQQTTLANAAILAPGNSAGNMTFAGGIDLSAGGIYRWELGALSTSNPGTDFDTIAVTGGSLTLGGTSALALDFGLIAATGPNSSNPFWSSSQTWKIVDVTTPGTNAGNLNLSAITNASSISGTFATNLGSGADAGDVFLVFTPFPAATSVWQGANNDPWTAVASWSGSVPNNAAAEAKFVTTGGTTANLDANQTVNKLTFEANSPHTISGANTLTLAGLSPSINTAATNTAKQTVAVNLELGTGTTISVQGGTLELNVPTTNPTIGAGVTATIASGAALSLGGAGNALSNGTTTHINVTNSGTLAATTAGKRVGNIDGTGTTSVTTSGATLTANHIRQSGLMIGAGNTVTIAANGGDSGTSVVTNLSISATGKLDLKDNDLIVNNGNLAALTALLATALDINGSYGNGPGITSSTFASNPNFNTVLGIAPNSELGYATFSGQTVESNDVLIKYTYYGDADLNGVVDGATDFDLYVTGLTNGGSFGGWLFGDFDYNGTVDSAADFDLYITGLASQGGPLLIAGGGGAGLVQAVPEPTTLVLAGLGMLGFAGVQLRRRHQRRQTAEKETSMPRCCEEQPTQIFPIGR